MLVLGMGCLPVGMGGTLAIRGANAQLEVSLGLGDGA